MTCRVVWWCADVSVEASASIIKVYDLSSTMLMDAASSIDTAVRQNTRCHIQEDSLFYAVTMFLKHAGAFKFYMALGCQ
jgi:hypothetical protein